MPDTLPNMPLINWMVFPLPLPENFFADALAYTEIVYILYCIKMDPKY